MAERVAVYAGSFDPLTNGHLYMIERGADAFDRLIVAIGVNPDKHCLFTVEERIEMIRQSTTHLSNIEVDQFTNKFLITYAAMRQARFILRGIRSVGDFEYERTMRNINGDINAKVDTFFLIPPRELAEVSSSFVKGLIGPDGWQTLLTKYVPPAVFKKIKEKRGGA